uniref:Uncharacterized protein n=1 Tax=Arundo donax TaxID=35708 RepID=A0A0A9HGX9_ARUDO
MTRRLEVVPGKLNEAVKEIPTLSASQALAITKSQYPRVDIKAIGEGFAAGVNDDQALDLLDEVKHVAAALSDNIHL